MLSSNSPLLFVSGTYQLDRVHVLVQCDHSEINGLVRESMDLFGLQVAEKEAESHDIEIRLITNKKMDVGSWEVPDSASHFYNDIKAWSDGEQVKISDGLAQCLINAEMTHCMAHIQAWMQLDRELFTRKMMTTIVLSIFIMLRRHNYFPLHAAGLTDGSKGVLISANSGSGKSTLSYGLVRAGWYYLSDDSILLHAEGADIHARPFRSNFGLGPGAVEQFPEIEAVWKVQFNDDDKRVIPLEHIHPGKHRKSCVPDVLLFPEIRDQETSVIEEMKPAEAIMGVIRQSALLTLQPEMARKQMSLLKRLVSQTKAYRLYAGRDLKASPERVASLLREL